ncbi:two-component regulator propeller domain-containing protein [Sphingobacterium sp. Mn56C]|uniref:two-component regulator propeller domain-containing protein n=1 Tax=Sphingobacterium sp. Mn56C TaxID=3395261 RepID=UPI003BBBDFEA
MKATKYLLLFACIVISSCLYSQIKSDGVRFFHLNAKHGLSQSSVFAIEQDHLGFIWVGTRDGLNRYDAKKIVTYKNIVSDSTSLSDNYITSIFEDKKKRMWVGTARGINLYDRNKDKFKLIPIPVSTDGLPMVNAITEDRKGNLWFSTSQGLYVLWIGVEPLKLELIFDGYRPDNINRIGGSRHVQQFFEDSYGRAWLSTVGGIYLFHPFTPKGKHTLIRVFRETPGKLNCNDVRFVFQMKPDVFWFGTKEGGINVFHEKKNHFSYYGNNHNVDNGTLGSTDVRSMIADRFGGYWIGTINRLFYYTEESGFTSFKKNERNIYAISDNSIRPIMQDNRGSIWVGTYYGGVNVFDRNIPVFKNYSRQAASTGLSYDVVSGIIQDAKANFWVATEGGGLNYLSADKTVIQKFVHDPLQPNSLSTNHIKAVYLDKEENLWVGTYNGGLNFLKKGSSTFKHFKVDLNSPSALASNNVYSIIEDDDQRLWIGTYGGGVSVKDAQSDTFIARYSHNQKGGNRLTSDLVRTVFIDSRKNVWIGTDYGLNVRWHGKNTFEHFMYDEQDENSISGNVIISLFEDSKGTLWVSTFKNGVNTFNYEKKNFKRIKPVGRGNTINDFYGIVEVDGLLWFSNDRGLGSYNPQDGTVKKYNIQDGLVGNEFSMAAVCKSRSGELLFGGTHGITAFFPKDIPNSAYMPKVAFTDFKVFNKSIMVDDEGPLKANIVTEPTIVLQYKQNFFSVDFATLSYIIPEKNRYAYRLEGFDDRWNYVSIPTATYTNLPAGTYTLKIKGASNDGVWSDRPVELKISILPPPWKTWWAYLLYGIFLLLMVYLVVHFLKSRLDLQHQLEMKGVEAENERRIAELKANFFTNISHELRTPLTLILGPLDNILPSMPDTDKLKPTLTTMHKNGQQLLKLVNELLDLRKNELGHTRLRVAEFSMRVFLNEVLYSFKSQIALKEVALIVDDQTDGAKLWFDRVQMEKVFYNLLANAVKYVPKAGEIKVVLLQLPLKKLNGPQVLSVQIWDNGHGIPLDEYEAIFGMFYQADNKQGGGQPLGTGIGLALAKEIVMRHHGKLNVQSHCAADSPDSFTCFTVDLLMGNSHFTLDELIPDSLDTAAVEQKQEEVLSVTFQDIVNSDADTFLTPTDTALPLLLIVDDNEDIRNFLFQGLATFYQVILAEDGDDAVHIIQSKMPDLIVSDVMMPNMDGVSLLKKIKEDSATAHIPVLLLTALSADVDMRRGMYAGADDYLVKPVNIELLALKIQNILYTRKCFRKTFIQDLVLKEEFENEGLNGETYAFLKKVLAFIEDNLTESELNVVRLSNELGMSRPVLYRKVKQITGLSVIELINLVRMRNAVALLCDTNLFISEIAYQLGYSDPKYFSKTFKAFYGITPTQFSALDRQAKAELMNSNQRFKLWKDFKRN